MKRVIYYFLVLLSLSGCEKFLETNPADQYSEATFWQNSTQFEAALAGIYNVLRGPATDWIFYGDILSPNATSISVSGDFKTVSEGNALKTSVLFLNTWKADYRGIGRANELLSHLGDATMDNDLSTRIEGEAKFLRAFFYFDLLNKFGKVPIITESYALEQGKQGRDDENDVLSLILSDLEFASEALLPDSDPGRATKGAALALKARVYLYNGRWEDAANAAVEVMKLNKYSLYPNYGDLFKVQHEHNQEVIWDIEFLLPNSSHALTGNTVLFPFPTLELVNDYYMNNGKSIQESDTYNPANPFANRDPRLYQSVRLVGEMFNGAITQPSDVSETHTQLKKWLPYDDDVHSSAPSTSDVNPIVIRYGEVLLTFAEAKNEISGPIDSVYDAINQIRQRPSVNMPTVDLGLTKDEMRDVIHHERRVELALEGYYYYDIRRWNIVGDVMNKPVHDLDGNIYQVRSFTTPKDLLFSVPSDEIDLNPNLLPNNPGW